MVLPRAHRANIALQNRSQVPLPFDPSPAVARPLKPVVIFVEFSESLLVRLFTSHNFDRL